MINLTITNLMIMSSISSSPMYTHSRQSFALQFSTFSKFASPFLHSLPKEVKFRGCLFSKFIKTPIQLRQNDARSLSPTQDIVKDRQLLVNMSASFEDTKFIDNTALGSNFNESCGGAIFVWGEVTIVFKKCTFQRCAANNAGALCLCCCSTNISECTFEKCIAYNNVGAIWALSFSYFSHDCNLFIEYSNFTDNKAGENCGAINANLTNTIINNCKFIGNTANLSCGAVALIGEYSSYLNYVEFINNSCLQNGAALWIQGNRDYMKNIFKISLNFIVFENNRFDFKEEPDQEKTTSSDKLVSKIGAIHTFGIVSLFYDGEICFDGVYENFIRTEKDKNFLPGQNFREILFNSSSKCPFKLVEPTPVVCEEFEYTNPYIENRLIKNKLALFLPIFMM
ncbi:hypothetical protein TRFO_20173 [Tritrichomonas foetus]|uniref:Right handed beta helix domain-containing protein n=1 Tax=Tritrichomonas foetus TaxID=1144522 RepID=A0A1J4KHU7_9EUKA|nr:hypothetical protein TRFO_20173 [Tritrichomonas foetus]|eukprot:OHT10504.1 hypothetical protein TRFO_20173 [Tritrichomonas foetus]